MAVMNFLTFATYTYVDLVAAIDPVYVLYDPMIWTVEDKIFRTWSLFMFMEDINHHRLSAYFQSFPFNWKEKVKHGSLVDIGLTTQIEKGKISTAKVLLADRVINREIKRKKDPLFEENVEYLQLYEDDISCIPSRGLDTYREDHGPKFVVKLKRNSAHHYNQIAFEQEQPMQCLKTIIDIVDNAFDFSCSTLFWLINATWLMHDLDWQYHKDMLKGDKSWQDELDREKERVEESRENKRHKVR